VVKIYTHSLLIRKIMKKLLLMLLVLTGMGCAHAQNEPYIGEIRLFTGNFAPRGWAFCSGQLLSIAQNQALFSLLGTTYGGDGMVTFALPDLRGRVAMHTAPNHPLGERGGETSHSITINEMPMHIHSATAVVNVNNGNGTTNQPTGNYPAVSETNAYTQAGNVTMSQITTTSTTAGSMAPVNNMQPYLVVNYIIAVQGIFPSQQ
jgi:microcystin-dependent protein